MKLKHKIIWFPRVTFPCAVGFCPSEKAWKKFLKKNKIKDNEPYPGHVAGNCMMYNEDSGRYILITVNGGDYTPVQIIGLIAHECTHAFEFMCDIYGEKFPSSEFKAYSMQSFVQECVLAYEETKGKITKE